MAEISRNIAVERDVEQAIVALKKGAYLLKYGRRGKPKFCPFRLANDESVLIWYSGKDERQLKVRHISRIVPGQRTLKGMAERVPVGAKNKLSQPGLCGDDGNPSLDSAITQSEDTKSISSGLCVDSKSGVFSRPTIVNGPTTHNNSNCRIIRNGLNTSQVTSRNGNRSIENHPEHEGGEWVEQHEPGVYITLISLPGGGKDLKRVRFSRKRFSERQA